MGSVFTFSMLRFPSVFLHNEFDFEWIPIAIYYRMANTDFLF